MKYGNAKERIQRRRSSMQSRLWVVESGFAVILASIFRVHVLSDWVLTWPVKNWKLDCPQLYSDAAQVSRYSPLGTKITFKLHQSFQMLQDAEIKHWWSILHQARHVRIAQDPPWRNLTHSGAADSLRPEATLRMTSGRNVTDLIFFDRKIRRYTFHSYSLCPSVMLVMFQS